MARVTLSNYGVGHVRYRPYGGIARSDVSGQMIPAGYLLKRIVSAPGWLVQPASGITDICSVSACCIDDVVDVQEAGHHNGFGVANDPDVLTSLANQVDADLRDASLFYYTAYERELDSNGWTFDPANWQSRTPARSAGVADNVRVPDAGTTTLLGYDVVVFGDFLEHSPLFCNSVAEHVPVNAHCLLKSLDEAVGAIDAGAFGDGCEEGAYTIFAVYRVD